VAQRLVRNLDEAVKEALRRRAQHHGRSLEEEARLILSQAAQDQDPTTTPAGLGLNDAIPQWEGQDAEPTDFSGWARREFHDFARHQCGG
jgi:plasmid stability protein